MSVTIATQTTTFLPANPPVLKDRKLNKRFLARMKRILSRDLIKGKKIAKEEKTNSAQIRYIMTHMGIIANDNEKYYKELAKNKRQRTVTYQGQAKYSNEYVVKSDKIDKIEAMATKTLVKVAKDRWNKLAKVRKAAAKEEKLAAKKAAAETAKEEKLAAKKAAAETAKAEKLAAKKAKHNTKESN